MTHIMSDYHLKYIDVFDYQNHLFIVTELHEISLESLVAKSQTVTEEFIKYTMFCIVSGVHSIHKSHAIHRNIAPSSIYLAHECALLGNMKDTIFLVRD